jgi:L-iditol 2-dehydrogenase
MNATKTDVVAEILEQTGGKGARVVIDCAGTGVTMPQTVKVAKAGGKIVLVGLAADSLDGVPLGPISTKELTLTSIFRYKNLYPTTIQAIAEGKIDITGIISNRYRFEDTPRAYAESVKNIKDIVKGVIVFA